MKHSNRKEKKEVSAGRGIATMLRIVTGNNQRLSDMADNKAHIMITVNSIILSVVIGVLIHKIKEFSDLALLSILLLPVNIMTIIFSTLATRPSLPSGEFSQKDLHDKKLNLLFFGNFFRMNAKEYTDNMFIMMKDAGYLYRSMLKDIYAQGAVLSRKYRLLRIAYNTFMYGILAAVLAFIISTIHSNDVI